MELFDFLHDLLPKCDWFQNLTEHNTFDLSEQDIIDSVQSASNFFNLGAPQNIREGWATGVLTDLPFTEKDDVIIFNRQQLSDMGINDKESFTLVMSHEGAHRALQNLDEGFNFHQEELCCDYLAGVQAGLNDMDTSKMEASLQNTAKSTTHPAGNLRVSAIEMGVEYGHSYHEEHNAAPTLTECIENFKQSVIHQQINLRPENIEAYFAADIDWIDHKIDKIESKEEIDRYSEQELNHCKDLKEWTNKQISFGARFNDKGYYENLAKKASEEADYYAKEAQRAFNRGDIKTGNEHLRTSEKYAHEAKDYLKCASECTQ